MCACLSVCGCVCVCVCVYMQTHVLSPRVCTPEWTKGNCCILYNVNAFILLTVYEQVCRSVEAIVFSVHFFPHSAADTPCSFFFFLYLMYEMLTIVS